jgi:hypothetical protein
MGASRQLKRCVLQDEPRTSTKIHEYVPPIAVVCRRAKTILPTSLFEKWLDPAGVCRHSDCDDSTKRFDVLNIDAPAVLSDANSAARGIAAGQIGDGISDTVGPVSAAAKVCLTVVVSHLAKKTSVLSRGCWLTADTTVVPKENACFCGT